jgi:membrane-bound serine protease (ClpP class)
MIATDLDDLVVQLDGWQVTLLNGTEITIHTEGAIVNDIKMSTVEDVLYTLSNPNIAYILMSLGMLGIFIELSNPGIIIPGVVGGICLVLAFYSLGMLPINYAGVALIGLAFGLFIAEIFTTSFGILTAGGVTSLVIGSLILFTGGSPLIRIEPWVIAIVAVCAAAVSALIVNLVVRAHHKQASTGREGLIGKTAVVRTTLEPEGTVFLKGEGWSAESEEGKIKTGEEVTITRVDGLKLWVTKKNK